NKLYRGPVLFIKGGASDYIQDQHWSQVRALFPAASIEVMPGSGHWLHVEQPALFNSIVARFLTSLTPVRLVLTENGKAR
ncbi:MAG TPA: hypothetical protein VIV27_01985, partial [Halioglobus sp.]